MHYIIGIDEVGRGSLAGPILVVAAAIPSDLRLKGEFRGVRLKDSKKLTKLQRKKWFDYLTSGLKPIYYQSSCVWPRTIEGINIKRATNLAAKRAYLRLVSKYRIRRARVYLDGGLELNIKSYIFPVKTLPKGDEKIKAIKIASIIAKEKRDRMMKEFGKKYPNYGFELHMGYGTKFHIKNIKTYGPTPIHRLTFIKRYIKIGENYGWRSS